MNKTPAINMICIGLVAGIFLDSKAGIGLIMGLYLAGLLLLVAWIFARDLTVRFFALTLGFVFAGVCLYSNSTAAAEEKAVSGYQGREVVIEGFVYEDPDRRDDFTNLKLQVDKISTEERFEKIDSKILIRADKYPDFKYGDILQIRGVLEEPPEDEDFSYRDYLARQQIYSWMRWVEDVEQLEGQRGNVVQKAILKVKHVFENKINQLIHEPESSLLAGLLLGVRRGFSEEFKTALQKTGTTHIIAISGYNISIIILLLQKLMGRYVPRKRQLPFFTFGIGLFTLLVGASASVVRAALMGWLVLLAGHFGRLSRVTSSLLIASAVMLVFNPMTFWDLGFQLSFLATGGIIWVYPLVGDSRWYAKLLDAGFLSGGRMAKSQNKLIAFCSKIIRGAWVYFWETLLVTLAAQALVLPVLIYNFGQLSLISPVVNLFVLFMIPWVMLAGFVAVVLGFVSWLVAMPFVWVAWVLLYYIVEAIGFFSTLPFAMLNISNFPGSAILIWFGLVGLMVVKKQVRNSAKTGVRNV